MCGIFGYVGGKNNAPQIVLEGLKKLEYRGYDSWGIGVEFKGEIKIDKHAGKIGKAKVSLPKGNFAFGHTRWATHGAVTKINAHPHLDCDKKIAIVHNGIVENYQEIKKRLGKKHKIISETDTELIAHLIEDYRQHYPLKEAVRRAFLELEGLSAFLVAEATTRTLIAIKTGSPLVLGIGEKENFISSDTNSLLSLTRKIIFLEDNQLAELTEEKIAVFDLKTAKKIKSQVQKINWEETVASKENFPHFMIKEIFEQPKIISNIVANSGGQIKNLANLIKKSHGTFMVGCGTAAYASLAGQYLFSKIAKRHLNSAVGSEFTYQADFLNKKSLVIALSQSGETADIIESVKMAKAQGAKIAALVNTLGSTLYRLADFKILLNAGPEKCVLSTKSFTAKLANLVLIAEELVDNYQRGEELLKKTVLELKRLFKKEYQSLLKRLVSKIWQKEHMFIIGRGQSYPVSLEAALKIKEGSYIHAEGFAAGELKHGVIALVEKGTPCLVFAPNDETYGAVISGAMEMRARGGFIIGVSFKDNEVFDFYLPVADCAEATIIPNIVIAQLLGYYLAVKRGHDPDKPRNLAKSVTVK